ncbi:O-methyltransferase-domain-containing protein [Xylariales sp. PMI_506]|nr:O-methyltransferase-domain-containing protein [Xylariales sp. PMI_506]
MAQNNLIELSGQISGLTKKLANQLNDLNCAFPSLTLGGLEGYPDNIQLQETRMGLIDVLDSLKALVLGPRDHFQLHVVNTKHDLSALNMLYRFNILTHIPISGSSSVEELAAATGLPVSAISRILRHSELLNYTRETIPGSGRFEHTSFSAHIVKTPGGLDWLGHNIEQSAPASLRQAEAVEVFAKGGRQAGYPNETGMGLQYYPDKGKDYSIFDFLTGDGEGAQKGWRMRRCAAAMGYMSHQNPGGQSDYVLAGFDWDACKGLTVLDLGGSRGHLSVDIARRYPDIKFIVNDLPMVESGFNATKTAAGPVGNQLTFLAHDFFESWPAVDFDIVMMRYILHDWSDQLALKLLRNLVPALKPASRIFVIENMTPEVGDKNVPRFIRHSSSSYDFQMWSSTNGKERALSDWKELFVAADPRFGVQECRVIPGSAFMFVTIVFGA